MYSQKVWFFIRVLGSSRHCALGMYNLERERGRESFKNIYETVVIISYYVLTSRRHSRLLFLFFSLSVWSSMENQVDVNHPFFSFTPCVIYLLNSSWCSGKWCCSPIKMPIDLYRKCVYAIIKVLRFVVYMRVNTNYYVEEERGENFCFYLDELWRV